MYVVKNGFGNNMIIQLWVTLFKNQVGTLVLLEFMELIKLLQLLYDSSAIYCWAHPLSGGKQIVCESWRNLISVGAKPIAITNCLNFGSPENEENMGEFVECVQGLGEASTLFRFPSSFRKCIFL